MKTICFYHNDADGILSAAFVNFFEQEENKKFIPINYGERFPWEEVENDDIVYMVDFSLEPYSMIKISLICKKFIWIDHHESAIRLWKSSLAEEKKHFPGIRDLDGIRNTKKAACRLVKEYFTKDKVEDPLLNVIETSDIWNANTEEEQNNANLFNLGFISCGFGPDDLGLFFYLQRLYKTKVNLCENGEFLYEIRIKGEAVGSYLKNKIYKKSMDNSFESELCGLRILATNSSIKGASQLLPKFDPEKHDAMCVFCFNGEKWEYSFYTEKEDINLGEFCVNLAKNSTRIGGGHPKAAGCTLNTNIFNV